MHVQPYLFFDGRCEEAIAFYRKALGAEVTMLMRFKDAPPPPEGSKAARRRRAPRTRSCIRASASARRR